MSMQAEKVRSLLSLAIRVALGLLFIYASMDKIWNPALFAKAISNYRILPLPLLHISAIILPWLEFITGLALLLNKYPRAANLMIGGLLLVFTLGIVSAMARGLDFNCGCFDLSSDASNLGSWKLFQNSGLLIMVMIFEWLSRIREKHN